MKNKKIAVFSAISILALGAAGASITLTSTDLVSEVKAEDGLTIVYQKDQPAKTANGVPFLFENVGEVLKNTDPVQKITKVYAISPVEEDATYQLGYVHEDQVMYTDPLKLVETIDLSTTTNKPAYIKISNQVTTSLKIDYSCVTDGLHDAYPEVEKGMYIVGEGSFINENHPFKWDTRGGLKMTTLEGENNWTIDGSFKSGDQFKFKTTGLGWENEWWANVIVKTPEYVYVIDNDNIVFAQDFTGHIDFKGGNLIAYKDVSIKFSNVSSNWGTPHCWAWGKAGDVFTGYPGPEMTKVDETTYSITLPDWTTGVKFTGLDNLYTQPGEFSLYQLVRDGTLTYDLAANTWVE